MARPVSRTVQITCSVRPARALWSTRWAPSRVFGALRVVILSVLSGGGIGAQVLTPSDSVTLQSLHAAVRRSSPELRARRAAVDAARARAAAVGLAAPLVLSAETEEVPDGLALARAGSLRLDVSKEFLGGKRRTAARTLARADVDAEAAALIAAERRVLALADRAVARAVLWAAVARRRAAEEALLTSADSSLRTRFSVGQARYVDVLRLRTERLRVQSEQAVAVTEALAARRALDALLAPADPGAGVVVALLDSLARRDPVTSAALPPAPDVDSLVAASATYRAAAAAVTRARAVRAVTAAEQRPRVAGFAGVQRFTPDAGRYTLGPVLGASVSLPFTARRANTAALLAADREIAAATASREAAVVALRADLLAARDRYDAARTRLSVFDAALLRGAREERETALASFRSGELSLIELLDFERALTRAETDRLRSRLDAADALADLLAGAFGPSSELHSGPATRGAAAPTDR
ncbi:MAG: TolC family protein [Gemmatimonadaceae bacterium]